MGGTNINPTPVELKTRIRLLLMGASPAVAAGSASKPSTSGASVAMEEESPVYLSATVLEDLRDGEPVAGATDDDLQEIGQLLKDAQAAQGPSTSHPVAADSDFSPEGMAYVAGYLAHKLRDVDSSLGTMSSECPPSRIGADCEWTRMLSRGGLYLPSPEWRKQMENFEVVFSAMHKPDIDREPGVLRRLREDLERKFPRIDPRVIRKYAVTRTHMRIKLLRRRQKEAANAQKAERDAGRDAGRNAKRMRMYAQAAK